MVQIVGKNLFEVAWFYHSSFETVEEFEGSHVFIRQSISFIPAPVDDLLKKHEIESSSFIVLTVVANQLLFLLPLGDSVESKVMNYALEIVSRDVGVTMGKKLEGIAQITQHVWRQLLSAFLSLLGEARRVGT